MEQESSLMRFQEPRNSYYNNNSPYYHKDSAILSSILIALYLQGLRVSNITYFFAGSLHKESYKVFDINLDIHLCLITRRNHLCSYRLTEKNFFGGKNYN